MKRLARDTLHNIQQGYSSQTTNQYSQRTIVPRLKNGQGCTGLLRIATACLILDQASPCFLIVSYKSGPGGGWETIDDGETQIFSACLGQPPKSFTSLFWEKSESPSSLPVAPSQASHLLHPQEDAAGQARHVPPQP